MSKVNSSVRQSVPKSFHTHQLPNISFKQPFKQSREIKSYVSFKEITEATSKEPRVGLLDLARDVLSQKNEPVEILTNRLAHLYRKRSNNKENSSDCHPGHNPVNHKQLNFKDRFQPRHRRPQSQMGLFSQGKDEIVLKICRLELHDNSQQELRQAPQPRVPRTCSRACPNTSRTLCRRDLVTRRSRKKASTSRNHYYDPQPIQGRLSAWQISNFDDDF